MTEAIPNRKPEIIGLLQLIASEEQLLAYERNVPHVDVTAELLCLWFDDQYCPHDAYFISCFSPGELAALAEFDRYYEERRCRLPESQGMVRTWLASPVWQEIMRKARETVARIAT